MNTPTYRYVVAAFLALLPWTPFGLRAQTADCARGVVVLSPVPELQSRLRSRLTAQGLQVVSNEDSTGCGTFTVQISGDSINQYEVMLRDTDGHESTRTLHDIETVVTLVESWARPNAADSLGLLFPEPAPEPVAAPAPAVVPEPVTPPEMVAPVEPEPVPALAADAELPAALLLLPGRRMSPVPSISAAFVQSGPELSQGGARAMACMGREQICGGYDVTFAAGPSSPLASSPSLAAWLHADVAFVSTFRDTLMFTGLGVGARWMSGAAVFTRLPQDQQRTIIDATRSAPDDDGAGSVPSDGSDTSPEPVVPPDPVDPTETDDGGEAEDENEQGAEQKAAGDDPATGRVSDSFSLSTQLFVYFDIPMNDRIALTPGAAFLIAPVSSSIDTYQPPGLDWSVLVWVGIRPGRHR